MNSDAEVLYIVFIYLILAKKWKHKERCYIYFVNIPGYHFLKKPADNSGNEFHLCTFAIN
jgi:hypothetical protein